MRPEDIPVPEPAAETADAGENAETAAGMTEQGEQGRALRIDAPRMSGPIGSFHAATALDPAAAKRKEIGLSAALADDLRAIRHQILQAHLELWRKLGDDGVKKAAYRGGC